jgi:hypothetical protein
MTQVAGLIRGLLKSCLKNLPMIEFSGSNRSERAMAAMGQEETTKRGLSSGDRV